MPHEISPRVSTIIRHRSYLPVSDITEGLQTCALAGGEIGSAVPSNGDCKRDEGEIPLTGASQRASESAVNLGPDAYRQEP